jgi:hypothetical protein
MRHGLVDDCRQWPYSSYYAPQATCPLRDKLFTGFQGRGGFEREHTYQWPVPPEQIARLAPDDFDRARTVTGGLTAEGGAIIHGTNLQLSTLF